MLATGPALRVTIHLNADISSTTDFLHEEVLMFLRAKGASGATMFRPEAGFGFHHVLHTKGGGRSESHHLPIRIEFTETKEWIDDVLPELLHLVTDGMVEVQETTILKIASQEIGGQR